jgi:hypothetical protein
VQRDTHLAGLTRKEYSTISDSQRSFEFLSLLIDFRDGPSFDIVGVRFRTGDPLCWIYVSANRPRGLNMVIKLHGMVSE